MEDLVDRLRKEATTLNDEQAATYSQALDPVVDLLSENRIAAALDRAAPLAVAIGANAYAARNGEAVADLEAFEQHWAAAARQLHEAAEQYEGVDPTGVPPAVRALADIARQSAEPYLDSATLCARADAPASGMYYLGKAIAGLEFAAFCRSVQGGGATVAPDPEPLLAVVESDLVQAFGSAEDRSDSAFILANTTVKTARALLNDGLVHGAWLKTLEARAQTTALQAANGPPPDRLTLRRAWSGMRSEIAAAGELSIARLVWNRVDRILIRPDATEADLRHATALLADVLPRCLR